MTFQTLYQLSYRAAVKISWGLKPTLYWTFLFHNFFYQLTRPFKEVQICKQCESYLKRIPGCSAWGYTGIASIWRDNTKILMVKGFSPRRAPLYINTNINKFANKIALCNHQGLGKSLYCAANAMNT